MLNEIELKQQVTELFGGVGVFLDSEVGKEAITTEMDSLQFISLICDIEEKFGVTFSDEELVIEDYSSINEFIDIVMLKIRIKVVKEK